MNVRQLFDPESSTLTYIVADKNTREAVIIDPVLEQYKRDSNLLKELGLVLKYVLETHTHADHVTSSSRFRAEFFCGIGVSHVSGVEEPDLILKEGDEIRFGTSSLKVLETPGHTIESMCFAGAGAVFTGDTLFVRGCGRTDFQGGSAASLYQNVHTKLFTMPDSTIVYPGHAYQGIHYSTIGEEKKFNPRLAKSEQEFITIMENLNLAPPKNIEKAIPANLKNGVI